MEVTIKEPTPSEELVSEAKAEAIVKDSKGRKLTLRNPGVLMQFRLVKIVGPELAENHTYMQMVLPLLYVAAIDDDVLAQPTNDTQIEALIVRLEEYGIAAVLKGVRENFGGAEDPEAAKTAAKK